MRFLAVLVFLSCFSLAGGQERPRRVLLVHSFARDFAPFGYLAEEFRAELSRRSPQPIEFLEASLEMARFEGVEKEEPLIEFLASTYREREPDLVVPLGAPAALFCHRNRARLFPKAPFLLAGSDRRRIPEVAMAASSTLVTIDVDLSLYAKGMAQVMPELRHLYVVFGAAPLEQFWEAEIKREWEGLLPGVKMHWLSSQSLAEIKDTLSRTPPQSAIFSGIISRDAAGMPFERDSALKQIHAVANAPIFGYSNEQFGDGVIGGRLINFRKCGRLAVDAALPLLAGEPPATVHTASQPHDAPVYDARELTRWRIAESLLPQGSTVLFRQPGLWEAHRTAVLVTLGIVLLQALLITLLLAASRRAKESEAGLRLTTEAASVGLWYQDIREPQIIKASPEWRALFGLQATGPLQLEDVLKRLHPEDASHVRKTIEEAARDGISYDIEHRIVLPDGKVRWIASTGRAESGADGRVIRTRGVSRDITERRQAMVERDQHRQELAHLSRVNSLGELSGALAHELNQPLGSILSNAQAAQRLLERDPADIAEVREILADIVSEDVRAGDVIKRLRALLKRGETLARPLHVNECIEEVLALMHADIIARGVSLARELDPALPQVMADRVQIQQVFLNVFSNACDAMDSRPAHARTLTVRTRREGDAVHIEVRDTGIGFDQPPEELFQPFLTTKSKGLGMGLPICRTIMEAHHGRISAEACPEGGAVFHLLLPVSAAHES